MGIRDPGKVLDGPSGGFSVALCSRGTAEFPERFQPWAGAEGGEQLPGKELNGNGACVPCRRSREGVKCQQLG